jgi:hemerythrin-like domain-containing protein
MQEHRLIERMVLPIREELVRIQDTNEVDLRFVDLLVDFIRTYADRCHHGKEEGVLFRELAKKPMSVRDSTTMKELIEEHVYARKTTSGLDTASSSYRNEERESHLEVSKFLNALADFYPKHIEKEDEHFFAPAMEYFSSQELDRMLNKFGDFDKRIIHDTYARAMNDLERLAAAKPK